MQTYLVIIDIFEAEISKSLKAVPSGMVNVFGAAFLLDVPGVVKIGEWGMWKMKWVTDEKYTVALNKYYKIGE